MGKTIDTATIKPERCLASKALGNIIDILHPETGLTVCFGRTIDEVREKHPDTEEMDVDEFLQWKAGKQRTPITWEPSTEAIYDEMLNVLPPAICGGGGFLVGEAWDHDALSGMPRYQGFRKRGGNYEVGSRPMTVTEFRGEAKK